MEKANGKIIKGVGGLYEVYVEDLGPVECRAKGILRYNGIRPLIGDDVRITILDREKRIGNLDEVLLRRNSLIRPAVANVDQAMIVFAMRDPEPHLNLLDRFLILMNREHVKVVICFNKKDKAKEGEIEHLRSIYSGSGCEMCFVEAKNPETMQQVYEILRNRTTVLAGPSGVGKSTIMNFAQPKACMETGGLSEKIQRGKNTTRHSQLNYVTKNTYLCDTPGFSSLYLPEDMEASELAAEYPEFRRYEGMCRFPDCVHRKEPDCAVKNAVASGEIASERYESYQLLHDELLNRKRW